MARHQSRSSGSMTVAGYEKIGAIHSVGILAIFVPLVPTFHDILSSVITFSGTRQSANKRPRARISPGGNEASNRPLGIGSREEKMKFVVCSLGSSALTRWFSTGWRFVEGRTGELVGPAARAPQRIFGVDVSALTMTNVTRYLPSHGFRSCLSAFYTEPRFSALFASSLCVFALPSALLSRRSRFFTRGFGSFGFFASPFANHLVRAVHWQRMGGRSSRRVLERTGIACKLCPISRVNARGTTKYIQNDQFITFYGNFVYLQQYNFKCSNDFLMKYLINLIYFISLF